MCTEEAQHTKDTSLTVTLASSLWKVKSANYKPLLWLDESFMGNLSKYFNWRMSEEM